MNLVYKFLILIIALQNVSLIVAKPTRKMRNTTSVPQVASTTQLPSVKIVDSSQPVYELQLAIWPTEVDDIIEAVATKPVKPAKPVQPDRPVKPVQPSRPVKPIAEQPIAAMPEMDYNDDDMLVQHDEHQPQESDETVEFDPVLDLWPTIEDDEATEQEQDPIVTLVNYHKTYVNGTHESKFILSNGMVNYQRIEHKKINGKKRTIQEGYYTTPVSSGTLRQSFQTVYYRADETGYNIYKTEKSPRNPAYDFYLEYTKNKNSNTAQKKPHKN